MRNAFGLIQAIMIILIISGIAVLTLKYASMQSKQYSDTFLREQALLFLQSATEATLFEISGYERNSSCIKNINIISPDNLFIAEMKIEKYFLYEGKDNHGSPWPMSNACSDLNYSIDYEKSHGMILLDAIVEINSTHPKGNGRKIRIVHRSLQRP